MPPVVGLVSTEDQLGPSAATSVEGEKVIDMQDRIRQVKPDQTQFTTMTDRLDSAAAIREKVNWLEEDLFPRIVGAATAQVAGDTTVTLTATQGAYVRANDILRNMSKFPSEAIRVASVAGDVVTIQRAIGKTVAQSIAIGDKFLVVADAQPQGSDFPTAKYLPRVLGFNYTQITRTTWQFTGTDTAIEKVGGREPAKEAKRKAVEHKRKWEAIGFFGARHYIAASTTNTEPQGFAGGMSEFIQTFARDVAGALTPTYFDLFLMDIMQYGSEDKVLFASPLVAVSMSQWNRSGMGSQWQPTPQNVHGVKVDAFISGAYGYRIPVVVKKEWGEFPNATAGGGAQPKGYGGYAFLVDMSNVRRRPLRDRDTKLYTEQQPIGQDSYAAGYITEATYEIAVENSHGLLYGVTAPP
jgi:Family of unknown function (DUF5309)